MEGRTALQLLECKQTFTNFFFQFVNFRDFFAKVGSKTCWETRYVPINISQRGLFTKVLLILEISRLHDVM